MPKRTPSAPLSTGGKLFLVGSPPGASNHANPWAQAVHDAIFKVDNTLDEKIREALLHNEDALGDLISVGSNHGWGSASDTDVAANIKKYMAAIESGHVTVEEYKVHQPTEGDGPVYGDALAKDLERVIPGLYQPILYCPAGLVLVSDEERHGYPRCKNWDLLSPSHHSVRGCVIHLNDFHRWTRQQIADWLDALHEQGLDLSVHEPAEEP